MQNMLENKIIQLHIVFGCTCDFDEDQILFYDQLMQKKQQQQKQPI